MCKSCSLLRGAIFENASRQRAPFARLDGLAAGRILHNNFELALTRADPKRGQSSATHVALRKATQVAIVRLRQGLL